MLVIAKFFSDKKHEISDMRSYSVLATNLIGDFMRDLPAIPKPRKWKSLELEDHENEPDHIPSPEKFEVPISFFGEDATPRWPEIMLPGIFFFPNESDF